MTRHPNYAARLAPLGLVLGFALGWHSACAQMRTFVSAAGNDANICTATSPCRTFQRAHDVGATGAEIEVIDPAGYGPLIISKSVSIQGHGVAGITQTSSNGVAVSIQGGSTAVVVLRGLVIEGGGLGFRGIHFQSGGSLDISDTIVHHFAGDGIIVAPTTDSKVSIRDTVANGNGGSGIYFFPQGSLVSGAITRTVADNNNYGVYLSANATPFGLRVVAIDSEASNNATSGFFAGSTQGNNAAQLTLDGVAAFADAGGSFVSAVGGALYIGHSRGDFFVCAAGANSYIQSFGDNRLTFVVDRSCLVTTPTN
jgi:hypothetical protein